MGWRGLGIAVLLALSGALVGSGVARVAHHDPQSLGDPAPVSAASPSFPTDPPVQVLPDPATPALATSLRMHAEQVGQPPFDLTVPVPNGWVRSNAKAGEWRWYVATNPQNTYGLRVVLPSGYVTIGNALQARIDALDGATGIQELTVESRTGDAFVATYVSDGHLRLAMERFLSLDGTQTVYASFALVGREADRAGMAALLDRVTDGARRQTR